MPDSLIAFCRATTELLRGASRPEMALEAIAVQLRVLLCDPGFVDATFPEGDDFSKRALFHCSATDYRVLAHVHLGPKEGPPHSHGASWAVYGAAQGVTGMKNWARVNSSEEEAVALRMAERYDLAPGNARAYGPHAIHSTVHPARACVIRVTGTDLDVLPRYRFKKGRDRIVGQA